MPAREFLTEVALLVGRSLVLPFEPAAGCLCYSVVEHVVVFGCLQNTLSAQDSFQTGTRDLPREYRSFWHLAFIQIKSYAGRSLKALILIAISIRGVFGSGTRFIIPTSIQSTTACTLGICSKNCSPSIRTRITFFLFR